MSIDPGCGETKKAVDPSTRFVDEVQQLKNGRGQRTYSLERRCSAWTACGEEDDRRWRGGEVETHWGFGGLKSC